MRKNSGGFSMIELMVVVTIISILSAIAIPLYQNYVIRAKVAEGFVMTGGARTAVAEYYSTNNALPGSNTEAGLDEPSQLGSRYVESVEIQEGGVVVATFQDPAIDGHILNLTPTATDPVNWSCSSSLPSRLLPGTCTSGASIAVSEESPAVEESAPIAGTPAAETPADQDKTPPGQDKDKTPPGQDKKDEVVTPPVVTPPDKGKVK